MCQASYVPDFLIVPVVWMMCVCVCVLGKGYFFIYFFWFIKSNVLRLCSSTILFFLCVASPPHPPPSPKPLCTTSMPPPSPKPLCTTITAVSCCHHNRRYHHHLQEQDTFWSGGRTGYHLPLPCTCRCNIEI